MAASVDDKQITIDGLHYKIGKFDFPYRWTGHEWVRSSAGMGKTIRKAIARQLAAGDPVKIPNPRQRVTGRL